MLKQMFTPSQKCLHLAKNGVFGCLQCLHHVYTYLLTRLTQSSIRFEYGCLQCYSKYSVNF